MKQRSLTLLAKLRRTPRAKAALDALAADRVRIDGIAQPRLFHDLSIHFARLFLIEEPSDSPYASWLVLETCFDSNEDDLERAVEAHLTELATLRHRELLSVLSACEGFDEALSPPALAVKLKQASLPSTAEYQGHGARDVARIRLELALRELTVSAAKDVPADRKDKGAIYTWLRARVCEDVERNRLDLDLTKPAPADPDPALRKAKLEHNFWPWVRNGANALPLLPCLPYVLVRERLDVPYDLQVASERRGPAQARTLADNVSSEDHFAQNALTHLVALKPGFIRKFVLQTAHRYIDALARNHFNYVEELGGIPSIHFAKWLLIDGGRRLLFMSNYDGSWESYLGDFVDQAAIGLNLAWTCTEGYPRTTALALGGANDEERFKAWARAHQRPTQIFYSAYPNLSVNNINNNTWLRHGLHAGGPDDLDGWLRRLT